MRTPGKHKRKAKSRKLKALPLELLIKKIEATSISARTKRSIFLQGDPANAIFFIHTGKVKITVVSSSGREATLSMLGPGEFFGEGCLVGQSLRMSSATTLEASILLRIDKAAMLKALHDLPDLTEALLGRILARNIDLEEDLCDQLFNHSEKRLARALLKLSRFGEKHREYLHVPKLSHEMLAEMVGTTRPRVTHFMNKFRKLGLIEYNDVVILRPALLTDLVLHD
ncbi:MAG TPA: Crp/Fnr family transcriptional regulator [Acidobacteriota bacterium]